MDYPEGTMYCTVCQQTFTSGIMDSCPNCVPPLKIEESDKFTCSLCDDGTLHIEKDCKKVGGGSDVTSEPYAKAGSLGLHVVEPLSNVLLIDLDTQEQEKRFYEHFKILTDITKDGYEPLIVDKLETVSKGGKKHVYLKIYKNLKPMTRIGLQAILGSDPKREVLSLRGVLEGKKSPNVLFETKEEHDKVVAWLNPPCKKPIGAVNAQIQKLNFAQAELKIASAQASQHMADYLNSSILKSWDTSNGLWTYGAKYNEVETESKKKAFDKLTKHLEENYLKALKEHPPIVIEFK